jgi:hypothetical protein
VPQTTVKLAEGARGHGATGMSQVFAEAANPQHKSEPFAPIDHSISDSDELSRRRRSNTSSRLDPSGAGVQGAQMTVVIEGDVGHDRHVTVNDICRGKSTLSTGMSCLEMY